ncbi:hypothetical protein C8A03DRAFT_36683 [Achaetomium macrosporum]|uniref:MYND-type domain-containing protein n=1 Tax=Achaetomium macrosporum TaxID=79813 RepID=A0AAN7C4X1_9PEZI|nr:hypothetical protein C8A03DRAFT_36683 [Achaetomium macrosporum]
MHTPHLLEADKWLHVGSFRPAISLTEDLPHGVDADILLLGCGDGRHILYTSFFEQGLPERKLDITACDIDEHLIARNVLFFTLLLDDDDNVSVEQLWNIYYHFYLDEPDMLLVCNQAKKLLSFSESLQDWHASSYGATLRFCDETTLSVVREIWAKYAESARFSTPRDESYRERFQSKLREGRRRIHDRTPLYTSKQHVSRSCAPLAMQIADQVLSSTHQHWDRGLTGPIPPPDATKNETSATPNPVFAVPLMESLTLKYPTNPFLSFHLAAAHAKLTELSPLRLKEEEQGNVNKQDRLFEIALMQFGEWTDAFTAGAPRTTIRFTASECFAFCYTLRYNLGTGETCAQWYRGKHGFDVLQLASSEYGGNGKAPKKFDVIDTSNLSDDTTILNLLVSAGPLLKDGPSSTLYTEGAQREDIHRPRTGDRFADMLCHNTTASSILLGLVPAEYWTNAKTVSRADEVLTAWSDEKATMGAKSTTYGFRFAWKQMKHMGEHQPPPAKLRATFDALEDMAHRFFVEILTVRVGLHGLKELVPKRPARLQHTTETAAAFLSAIGDEAGVDLEKLREKFMRFGWDCTGHQGEVAILFATHPEAFILESPTIQLSLSTSRGSEESKDEIRAPFTYWSSLPRMVAVTVVVPMERWKRLVTEVPGDDLKASLGTMLVGHMASAGKETEGLPRLGPLAVALYDNIQISFGSVTTEGSREQDSFTVHVQEDKAAWRGRSPMIVSFYAVTEVAQAMYSHGTVGLTAMAAYPDQENLETATLMPDPFDTACSNENCVFFTKHRPRQAGYSVTEGMLRALQKSKSSVESTPSSEPTFTLGFENSSEVGDISTITGRLNITSEKGKQLLADKAKIQLRQSSPFTINVVFGNKALVLPLTFPVPVLEDGIKSRIARTSGWIELIAPLAKPSGFPPILDDYMFPTALHGPSKIPATLNMPHLNLDNLPILALDDKSRTRFLTTLTSLQFSSHERRQRERVQAQEEPNSTNPAGLSSSARLNFKESLFTIFMLATGLQGGQTGLFALTHPQRGGIHMLLFASAVRLDGAHGSVVLDAAVLPLTKELVDSKELESFLLILRTLECCTLTVDDAELRLWKKCLPALAERCRTWSHDPATCEYAAPGRVPLSLEEGKQVLCSCGQGKLPDEFIPLPEWDTAARYATRVAISPVYASHLVEELIDPALAKAVARGEAWSEGDQMKACRNCGKTEEMEGVRLKKCLRCLEVVYCSSECQKKDWKKHRMECEESEIHHQGSAQEKK